MYFVVRFSTGGDMAAYTAVSPIYTSGAYTVRYLPYSIFNSGMHSVPIPAVIKEADSALLRPFGVHINEEPAYTLHDRENASAFSRDISGVGALSEALTEPAVHTEVEELNGTAMTRGGGRTAEKYGLPGETALVDEQAQLNCGELMSSGNYSGMEIIAPDRTEKANVRETNFNTYWTVSRGIFTASYNCATHGVITDSRSIGQIHRAFSTQYYYVRQAGIYRPVGFNYLDSRVALRHNLLGATGPKPSGTFVKPQDLADRGAVRNTKKHSLGYGERKLSSGDRLSVSAHERSTPNAFIQKSIHGLEHAVFRTGTRLADGVPVVIRSAEAVETSTYLSIPFSRMYKRAGKLYSAVELSKLFKNATCGFDAVLVNTAAHDNALLDDSIGIEPGEWTGEARSSVIVTERDMDASAFDVPWQTNIIPDEAAVDKGAVLERKRVDAEHLCIPQGLFWDELWEELYRDYGEKVDRLQLPPVDFRYDITLLYDSKTGEPYRPLSSADVPEVMVEFPASHPVGKYADVGLKIVNVHLWVLRDIILLLYRDLKENTYGYEKLPPGEAVRVAIDRLYNKLRQFDYRKEEYQRAFRMARWYGEYVIMSTNNYFLVREYEPWISHESSLNLENGIPKEDRPYVVRTDGWEVDRTRQVYVTRSRDAVLELNVSNLLPTVFEFTVEIVNLSGTASAKLTIDGRDKSYLLASLTRAEADLPKGSHTILFEFRTESDDDRMELSGMKVDYVKFRSAQVIESPKDVNGREAVDMLIGMLKRYYDLHHEGKTKGTRLFNLGKRPRLGR